MRQSRPNSRLAPDFEISNERQIISCLTLLVPAIMDSVLCCRACGRRVVARQKLGKSKKIQDITKLHEAVVSTMGLWAVLSDVRLLFSFDYCQCNIDSICCSSLLRSYQRYWIVVCAKCACSFLLPFKCMYSFNVNPNSIFPYLGISKSEWLSFPINLCSFAL